MGIGLRIFLVNDDDSLQRLAVAKHAGLSLSKELLRQVARARPKITSHFRISASRYLCPMLIRKIREIACYSCGFARSYRPNLTQI